MHIMKACRRHFLKFFGAGATALLVEPRGLFAEALTTSPSATEGPYYPPNMPLDTDNDLVIINSSLTSAVGQIAYLGGRILTDTGGGWSLIGSYGANDSGSWQVQSVVGSSSSNERSTLIALQISS